MTREEKSVAINEILDVLKSNQNIYLTDISGLNALETSNLRRMCFKAGVKLSVVKNTLLEKAMESSEKDFGELKETLKGLFTIKSKEELIGDIIMLLQSPAKNVISALSSSGGKLSGILQTLSNK